MKSVQIDTFSHDLATIHVADAPVPQPGPGQVRVKMLYSPINPSDLNFIRGTYHDAMRRVIWNYDREQLCFDIDRTEPCPMPPYALGGEGVGIVEATGSSFLARRLKGKRVAVAAGPPHGAWQEQTIVDARKAVPVPAGIDDQQAAMFFVNPLTAYILVKEVLRVPQGAWLLQTAAGSALGKSVVRMSKRLGFKTINIVRSDANTAELKELGADIVIETNRQDVLDEVKRATGGRGVRYALDCVGGSLAASVVRCLSLDGKLVVFGTLADEPIALPSRDLMMPVAAIQGFYLPNWLTQQSMLKLLSVLRGVKKYMGDGIFDTPIDAVYDLSEVKHALDESLKSGRQGKIMLRMPAARND